MTLAERGFTAKMTSFQLLATFATLVAVTLGQTTQPNSCGQTPIAPNLGSNGEDRIVGGSDAVPYSWPWQMVWCKQGWFWCSLECGGTLLEHNWAMTAGHCVEGNTGSPGSFCVKFGVFDENQNTENGELVVHVDSIHLHPQYSANPDPQFDIALIKLASPVQYTNHIQPVCLPTVETLQLYHRTRLGSPAGEPLQKAAVLADD